MPNITHPISKNELLVSLAMRLVTTIKRDDAAAVLEFVKSNNLQMFLSLLKELYPQSYSLLVRRVIDHAAQ